jgi:glucokinase
MGHIFMGIEIGGTKIQVFITDEDQKIIERDKFFVKEKEAAYIIKNLKERINAARQKYSIDAIGVGFGGPVDFETGVVKTSHHISGWGGFHLSGWISDETGIPVAVDNDANTAALAEACLGTGKGFSRVFYITMGSGVGGGLIVDGQIYHGNKPTEVEIGHIRLDKTGAILEDSCSGWAVDRKIRNYIREMPDSIIAGLVGSEKSGEARYLAKAIRGGDKGAMQLLEGTADDLAFGLSHAMHLFNPDIIILGGGLSFLGNTYIHMITDKLSAYVMKAMNLPDIKSSELKEDVVCLGASLLAKNTISDLKI